MLYFTNRMSGQKEYVREIAIVRVFGHINNLTGQPDGTNIYLFDGSMIAVKESLEEVMKVIDLAQLWVL